MFFAERSGGDFWKFTDTLSDIYLARSEPEQRRVAVGIDEEFGVLKATTAAAFDDFSPIEWRLLNLSLGTHQFSPRVELFNHVAADHAFAADHTPCAPDEALLFVAVQQHNLGAMFCVHSLGPEQLNGWLASAAEGTSELWKPLTHHARVLPQADRLHPASAPNPHPLLVLYADLTRRVWARVHRDLSAAVQTLPLRYVLRPCGTHPAPLRMQGWGAELRIKNMEYSVIDDRDTYVDPALSAQLLGAESEAQRRHDVGGFFFETLLARKPHLSAELEQLKSELVVAQTSSAKPKVWDLKDLGVQATQRALVANDPLQLLQELAQYFPSYAPTLTRLSVNKTVQKAVIHNQKIIGNSLFAVNGVELPLHSFSLFKLQQLVNRDVHTVNKLLEKFFFAPDTVRPLLSVFPGVAVRVAARSDDANFRVDMNTGVSGRGSGGAAGLIKWFNNLEDSSHPVYRKWPKDVQNLRAGWPGQLKYVRKNIVTLVLALDPGDALHLAVFKQARYFVNANAPYRLGVVFNVAPPAEPAVLKSALKTVTAQLSGEEAANVEFPTALESVDAVLVATPGRAVAKLFHFLCLLYTEEGDVQLTDTEARWSEDSTDADSAKTVAATAAWDFLFGLSSATPKAIRRTFQRQLPRRLSGRVDDVLKMVLLENNEFEAFALHSSAFLQLKGLKEMQRERSGVMFVANGLPLFVESDEDWRREMMNAVLFEQQTLAMAVHRTLHTRTKMDTFFSAGVHPEVSSRLSPLLLHTDPVRFASLLPLPSVVPRKERTKPSPHPRLRYVSAGTQCEDSLQSVSLWVTLDPSTLAGAKLGAAVLSYYLQHVRSRAQRDQQSFVPHARLALLLNGASGGLRDETVGALPAMFVASVLHSLHRLDLHDEWPALEQFALARDERHKLRALRKQSAQVLLKIFDVAQDAAAANDGATEWNAVLKAVAALQKELEEQHGVRMDEHAVDGTREVQRALCGELGLNAGELAVIVNGRVVTMDAHYVAATTVQELAMDIGQLVDAEERLGELQVVTEAVEKQLSSLSDHAAFRSQYSVDDLTSTFLSDVVMGVHHLLALRAFSLSQMGLTSDADAARLRAWLDAGTPLQHDAVLDLPGTAVGGAEGVFEVVAALDPLCEDAQRLFSVLRLLRVSFGFRVRLVLTPRTDLGELPLSRYYAFAAPEPGADGTLPLLFTDGGMATRGAVFHGLQSRNVLTLGLDTPNTWVAMSSYAPVDLDNIRTHEIAGNVLNAQFTLEHLLLAGQCMDETQRKPPAGLQVFLGDARTAHQQDTVVMQNLGYFQLKAGPGLWRVQLAPAPSRSSLLFRMAPPAEEAEAALAVLDWEQPLEQLRVERRAGMENEEIVEKGEETKGLWAKVSSLFGEKKKDEKKTEEGEKEKVHIFSVASGHLYERFLKIMMLSVVNHTSTPVKFWFIKNFLSPQFKEFIPTMAARFGFEVELVTYAWPDWLRGQSEKQRLIWAYKILFLDVLFPLSLRRVVFVDADQVVRGDMTELWRMDLNGAPYGYTPFCDSNHATEGFRFWKKGYWRDHLRGKPYHISALYVIDLDRFRQMRAGDTLRSIYDQLSRDKNSLSNLDQDLPNYAQDMVPIFSLPQEWLWCQTWCSMESLATAKTIDLCNNPLTKQPKLEVARTLIAEWPHYDKMAGQLEEEFQAVYSSRHDATATLPHHQPVGETVEQRREQALREAQHTIL